MYQIKVIEAFRQAGLEVVSEGDDVYRVINDSEFVDTSIILEKEPALILICVDEAKPREIEGNLKIFSRVFYGLLNKQTEDSKKIKVNGVT